MIVNITRLPVGTWFKYKEVDYKVISRDEYPFILCKTHDILFTNFEKVEVKDNTKLLDNPTPTIYKIKRTK